MLNDKYVRWSQWDTGGMIRCGTNKCKQIMEWMRELGMDAKKCVKQSDKDHAVYGKVMHDESGTVTEVRLYCNAYVTDEELEVISKCSPNDTLYVAHK